MIVCRIQTMSTGCPVTTNHKRAISTRKQQQKSSIQLYTSPTKESQTCEMFLHVIWSIFSTFDVLEAHVLIDCVTCRLQQMDSHNNEDVVYITVCRWSSGNTHLMNDYLRKMASVQTFLFSFSGTNYQTLYRLSLPNLKSNACRFAVISGFWGYLVFDFFLTFYKSVRCAAHALQ